MPRRFQEDSESGVATKTREKSRAKLQKPPLYRVVLHNDHYTTREFVVAILQSVFHHNETDAVQIMLHVHNHGTGVAGIYTYEVAESKILRVEQLARENEYPLRLTMEPEE